MDIHSDTFASRTRAVADALFSRLPEPQACASVGMRGASAVLLFLASYYRIRPEPAVQLAAAGILARLDELLAATVPATLYNGLTGAALAHRAWSEVAGMVEPDAYAGVFDLVTHVADARPEDASFDLIAGATGITAATLALGDGTPEAQRALDACLEWLEALAQRDGRGCYWETSVRWLPAERRPEGMPIRNLGLAHGTPGPVGVLASAAQHGRSERARALLRESARWVASKLVEAGDGRLRVPYWDDQSHEARLAWCYGAPGVGHALARAAVALGDEALLQSASQILGDGLTGELSSKGLHEPTLCHGYSGVAHMIHRTAPLLAAGGHSVSRLQEQAYGLYRQSLEALEEAVQAKSAGTSSEPELPDFDFLEGMSGAVQALIHAGDENPAIWEALLLTR